MLMNLSGSILLGARGIVNYRLKSQEDPQAPGYTRMMHLPM